MAVNGNPVKEAGGDCKLGKFGLSTLEPTRRLEKGVKPETNFGISKDFKLFCLQRQFLVNFKWLFKISYKLSRSFVNTSMGNFFNSSKNSS